MSAECCTKTLSLGCIPCSSVVKTLPFNALVSGTFTAYYKYAGTTVCKEFTGTTGSPLQLPVSGLNEFYTYYAYILDPNGERVTYNDGTNTYDCFRFRTDPQVGGTPDDVSNLCADLCELVEEAAVADVIDCVPSEDIPSYVDVIVAQAEATPVVIVDAITDAGKLAAVQALICSCPECLPIIINVNSNDIISVTDPCNTTVALFVLDPDDNPIGSYEGLSVYRIGKAVIRTTDGLLLVDLVNPEGSYNLRQVRIPFDDGIGVSYAGPYDTNFDGVLYLEAGVTVPQRNQLNSLGNAVNVGITLRNLLNDTLPVAHDASVQRKDSSGAAIGAPIAAPSNASTDVTCPDGSAVVRNSVPTVLSTTPVKSKGSVNIAVADSSLTYPDATVNGLPATVAFDIRTLRSGIVYQFGNGLWSGQTTVYQASDEGTLFAAAWYSYTRPVYPLTYARLGADFYTLAENNVWGNTLRFTDRAGAAAATSGDRVIQDHLTGLEWYRPNTMFTSAVWVTAVNNSAASTVQSSSDWWLPPVKVLETIANRELVSIFDHSAFLHAGALWTSTTNGAATTSAIRMLGSSNAGPQLSAAKSTTNPYLYCRRFI